MYICEAIVIYSLPPDSGNAKYNKDYDKEAWEKSPEDYYLKKNKEKDVVARKRWKVGFKGAGELFQRKGAFSALFDIIVHKNDYKLKTVTT